MEKQYNSENTSLLFKVQIVLFVCAIAVVSSLLMYASEPISKQNTSSKSLNLK